MLGLPSPPMINLDVFTNPLTHTHTQDDSKRVRLEALSAALECKPRPLKAGEFRLLLETFSNDDSEAVKESILNFLLQGPAFAEPKHAGVAALWLSKTITSEIYMFKFGVRHADNLYFCAHFLDRCRNAHTSKFVRAVLAGVCSVWDVPVNLENEQVKTECKDDCSRLTGKSRVWETAEKELNEQLREIASVASGESASKRRRWADDEDDFVRELVACKSKQDRFKFVKFWSCGFQVDSIAKLSDWVETGSYMQGLKFLEDFDVEDLPPPRKLKFNIQMYEDFIPRDAAFGLARFKLTVKAVHASSLSAESACELVWGHGKKHAMLVESERTKSSTVMYESVSVSVPFYGLPKIDALVETLFRDAKVELVL